MKKTTFKSGVVVEVPDNTTLVIGMWTPDCVETHAIGKRVKAISLMADLLAGILKDLNDIERAAVLSVLRKELLEKGILNDNVKMNVFYKDLEAPDDPLKVLLELVSK